MGTCERTHGVRPGSRALSAPGGHGCGRARVRAALGGHTRGGPPGSHRAGGRGAQVAGGLGTRRRRGNGGRGFAKGGCSARGRSGSRRACARCAGLWDGWWGQSGQGWAGQGQVGPCGSHLWWAGGPAGPPPAGARHVRAMPDTSRPTAVMIRSSARTYRTARDRQGPEIHRHGGREGHSNIVRAPGAGGLNNE